MSLKRFRQASRSGPFRNGLLHAVDAVVCWRGVEECLLAGRLTRLLWFKIGKSRAERKVANSCDRTAYRLGGQLLGHLGDRCEFKRPN
jgi:hypothetical protein